MRIVVLDNVELWQGIKNNRCMKNKEGMHGKCNTLST